MIHCTEWCEDGDEDKPYGIIPEVAWKDYKNRVGPPGRFVLKLYAVSNTWLGLTDEEGGVHTLATQDDINYYNGEYDDIPPGHYDYKDMPEAEKNMNKRRVEIENRARARFRDSRLYSDELHKLVMDCLIVQQESRIHVEELYRATKRFKELWAEKVGLQAPLPYFPEPTVKDAKLPPPWNDLNREQGGGLGRPVPEYLESHELGVDDLFHATTQYEKAAMVRLWARRNPIDNPSDDDIRQALGVIDRNARHFITYNTTTGQYRGQRNRPVYEIPEAFPGGDFIKYDRTDEDDGYYGGGRGYGGGGGDLGHPSPQQKLLGIANPDPDSDAIPDHLKNVQSTPEHMKARYSKDTPPELRGGVPKAAGDLGGGLGGFVRMEVEKERLDQELGDQLRSRSGSSLPHRGADQRRERKKAQAELEAREREREQDEEERLRNWPVFPTGLQKSIDEALITHALELPELQNSVLFCTVTERQLMKEMLTEKETGVPVEDMKLMGNDRLTVFREFEDEELRSVICGVEIFPLITPEGLSTNNMHIFLYSTISNKR
ncbi:hypothetical protein EYC80_003349 [Monilinia laxa]|nr:hypothetical protein EYC80_003349 [Monilinia laxa]